MEELKTGTTTVGIKYKDGVVLVADRRASMGYLVAHKNFHKIYKITDDIGMTMSGSVGHAQKILQIIRSEMESYAIKKGKRPTVKACASLISNLLFSYGLYVQLLVAGRDDNGYQVYTLTPDGANVEDEYISSGSGSVMAYGVLEDSFSKDMEEKAAVRIGYRAVKAAINRDIYTGDGIDVMLINKNGAKLLSEQEIKNIVG
jgi:proteasome beta subunit